MSQIERIELMLMQLQDELKRLRSEVSFIDQRVSAHIVRTAKKESREKKK